MRAFILIGVVAVASALHAQDALPAFEVVSIKQSAAPFQERSGIIPTPGRFTMEKAPAGLLIGYAYRGDFDEIRDMPDWVGKEYYDVTAPVPTSTPQAQIQAMVKRLLVERFHLATHLEQAEREVLALTRIDPAAPLPKDLEKVDVDCEALRAAGQTPGPGQIDRTKPLPPCLASNNGREIISGGLPMTTLVNMIRGLLDRQVVDRTGLEGNYRWTVRYTLTRGGDRAPEPTDDHPEITTALREQLGLKLVPTKITAKILVVDRFDRPEPN